MSPQRIEPAPRAGGKVTAIVALVSALIGGGGGIAITPHTNNAALVTKDDLREILAPVNTKLSRSRRPSPTSAPRPRSHVTNANTAPISRKIGRISIVIGG